MPVYLRYMHRTLGKALAAAALFLAPSFAFAAATAQIGALNPADGKVGVGGKVTFSMILSGFTNPNYYVTDSFAGGATTVNMDAQGNFSWTPNNDDKGTHVITVLVSDTLGNTASASHSFEVIAPTVAPATQPSASVQYGSTISFTLTYSGFTNPTVTVEDDFFNSSVGPGNLVGMTFSWTPQKKDVGTHNLTIGAKDAQGRTHSMVQKIVVLGIPSVSVLNLMPGTTVGAGEKFSFTPYTTEMENPEVTVKDNFYTVSTTTFSWDGKMLVWYPTYNDVGLHQFVLTAKEPTTGRTAYGELKVMVVPYATQTAFGATTTAASTTKPSTPAATNASASAYVFKTYLAVGSSGSAVTELQKKLVALGYLKVEPTGYFGAMTKKAVQDLQKANSLEQVGFVGPGTRAVLNK